MDKVVQDVKVLKSIWFSSGKGETHAERLDEFYKPQAEQYDQFRANFLWGREQMLAACAARLRDRSGMVWVDLGGGTGENVEMMSKYINLDKFKAIYVVDLCKSLCAVAQKKVDSKKAWKNVTVVEHDACTFDPQQQATLITFSYSLSMIPSFNKVIDKAMTYLDAKGLMGIADFYTSQKHDLPMRQHNWSRRYFWRAIFDIDGIDLGPERRVYLDHKLERVWEYNSEGSIPYVPYFRAPYYVWLGRLPAKQSLFFQSVKHEAKVEAPALFPPTFLYSQSWEDPEPDMKVMDINSNDVCLTLTSGGCNSLNLLLHGAQQVVSVDCNPAQNALMEMKQIAIRELSYQDVWLLFGEGKHPNIETIYAKHLAPFMTEASLDFWRNRLWYFKQGLYYQGGMGKVCWLMQFLLGLVGMTNQRLAFCNAKDLQEQKRVWNRNIFVRILRSSGASFFGSILQWLFTLVFLNKLMLWYGGGVPSKQYELIQKDGVSIGKYVARTFDGVAQNSHLRRSNYFYYNCMMGFFTKDNCPAYLKQDSYQKLKEGAIERLEIMNGTFFDALKSRKFTKVILMDHIDWCDDKYATELANLLATNMPAGGKVIWRSAAEEPFYAKIVQDAGFKVQRVSAASEGYMDRVNMYSSFYVATRKSSTD